MVENTFTKIIKTVSPEMAYRMNVNRFNRRHSKGELGLLEGFFAMIYPERAFRRATFRQGLEDLTGNFNYKAARSGRFRDNWTPATGSAEVVNSPDRAILRNRARAIERDSDLGKSAIEALVRNVIGTGIRIQANTGDDDLNNLLEAEFKRFCLPENIDITGHQHFFELQALFLRRMVVDGEIFAAPVNDKSGRIPFKIQTIESDMIDETRLKGTNGSFIVSGVEVNAYSRPLAYYFKQETPDGLSWIEAKRVNAEDVIHLFAKTRGNQVRGISMLANAIDAIRDNEEVYDALMVAQRIAACFSMFITKIGPSGQIGRVGLAETDSEGKKIEAIYPGIVAYGQPGEEAKAIEPPQTSTSLLEFDEIATRRVGMATGQGYEVVSRDMSKSNYSSARSSQLEDRKTWEPVQQFMIIHFLRPIWRLFVTYAVLSGAVKIRDFWEDPEKYFEFEGVPNGWDWIDPLKDVKATGEELRLNLTTLKRKFAERGLDWETELRQIALEREKIKAYGLEEKPPEPTGGARKNEKKD